jgi:hypothetical protein
VSKLLVANRAALESADSARLSELRRRKEVWVRGDKNRRGEDLFPSLFRPRYGDDLVLHCFLLETLVDINLVLPRRPSSFRPRFHLVLL